MNVIIDNYDVKLIPLSKDKIEMVRNWRNDPKISQYMEFRDYITPEMQEKWFERINNNQNYYFIIVYKDCEVGLINIKDIDLSEGVGESGSFIYEDRYLSTDIAYRAHLCMYDYYFNVLKYRGLRAHIKETNTRSVRFTLFLGYKRLNKTEYFLTKDDYLSNKNRIRYYSKFNKKQKKND